MSFACGIVWLQGRKDRSPNRGTIPYVRPSECSLQWYLTSKLGNEAFVFRLSGVQLRCLTSKTFYEWEQSKEHCLAELLYERQLPGFTRNRCSGTCSCFGRWSVIHGSTDEESSSDVCFGSVGRGVSRRYRVVVIPDVIFSFDIQYNVMPL